MSLSTSYLPRVRQVLSIVVILCGMANTAACSILLAYQLQNTATFQRPVPILLAASGLSVLLVPFFLAGSRKEASAPLRIVRSLCSEILSLGLLGALFLVATIALHEDTPGLLNDCGGFVICKMLTAVVVLSWGAFLALAAATTTILSGTIYHTVHRESHLTLAELLQRPFDQFDWGIYAPRATRAVGVKLGSLGEKPDGKDGEVVLDFDVVHDQEQEAPAYRSQSAVVPAKDEGVRAFDCRGH